MKRNKINCDDVNLHFSKTYKELVENSILDNYEKMIDDNITILNESTNGESHYILALLYNSIIVVFEDYYCIYASKKRDSYIFYNRIVSVNKKK